MNLRLTIEKMFVAAGAATFLLHSGVMTVARAATIRSVQSAECQDFECNRVALDESKTEGATAERDGRKIADSVRKNGSDEDRWKSFILFSDSRGPKDLSLSLVKSEGFSMRLEPRAGLLHFQKGGLHQAFAIAAPARASDIWAKQELCPNYGIQVLTASSSSAVFVKYCQPFTDPSGKNSTSEEYYLYDVKTATILALWFSATGDNSIPGPFVKPWPTVKRDANGYEINWKFRDATNRSLRDIVMRNRYNFESNGKTKSFHLKCRDLISSPNSDGDMCDGPANLKLMLNEGR